MTGEVISVLSLKGRHIIVEREQGARDNYDIVTMCDTTSDTTDINEPIM